MKSKFFSKRLRLVAALQIYMNSLAGTLRYTRQGLWRLASLVVVLATLITNVGTAFAIPPEPIDEDTGDTGDVPDHFIWNMLPRFGNDADADGIIDYHYDPDYVNPATFKVKFRACPAPGTRGIQYAWDIDGAATDITACMFTRDFTPGSHHVKFTATQTGGSSSVYEEDILVRDLLIVSLGDSYGSGEGNPDIRLQFNVLGDVSDPARWVDRRCHRSAYAGTAQAALTIERADPHTSVTFVSLACSGAQLLHLVLSGYMGPEPGPDDGPLEAQLKELRDVVGSRRIDSLVISAGGNDVGFGDIIAACVTGLACHQDPQVLSRLAADLTALPTRYGLVTNWIVNGPDGIDGPEPGLNVANVYFTEYPNPLHDHFGNVCSYVVDDILWPFSVNQAESTWAEEFVLGPLNATMRQAVDSAAAQAPNIGWHTISGISDSFASPHRGHGYCASGWEGWIRTAQESARFEGPLSPFSKAWLLQPGDVANTKGTMHPTEEGQQVYRDQILAFLLPVLFPGQSLSLGPSFSGNSSSGSTIDELGNNGWATGSCNGATCTSNEVVLEVVAADTAGIGHTTLSIDGIPACDSSSVSGVTCTSQALDARHYVWRFNVTAEGSHWLEFAARNSTDQVATFAQELKVDLTDPTATATITDATPNAAGWYSAPVSVTLSGADSASSGLGSGVYRVEYTLDGVAGQVSAGEAVSVATDGVHTLDYRSVDVAGRHSATQTLTIRVDTTPPAVICAAPDGQWHATDVSLACTASDNGSGLANAAAAAFSLSTSVANGSETANASTGRQTVCDAVGHCTIIGPIGGNQVDKKSPSITLTTPANTTYVLHQAVAASYNCSDGGSGVATCAGPVADSAMVDTASVGTKIFTVNASDSVGNQASQSVSYKVTYQICVLYDQTKAHRRGSTVPIKLQVCDSAGANASTAGLVINATGLSHIDNTASSIVEDSGNANPDSNFRFDSTLGGYIYNLSTNGLSTGTWILNFSVAGDPIPHTVQFDIR